MDFEFSDEEQVFADLVRRYARERLLGDYQRWDRGERYPRDRMKELAELGITGIRVPHEFGGSQSSYVMAGIAAEELGRGDHNVTLFLQIDAIAADIISNHACDRVKQEWLPGLASGERLIAFGLTEPDCGSDAGAIRATAKRSGEHWMISGEKASITFAGMADACIVFARSDVGGSEGIGAFLVPLDHPGVSRRVYESAGERLTERGSLIFDNAEIPLDYELGEPGSGFSQAMAAFDYNRAIIALCCIGAAQQSLDETMEYAKKRHTFGKPLAKREGVSFQIAEHLTMLEAARLLAYRCLFLADRGKSHTKEAAMAKWLGPKAAVEAIHCCIILNGWMGYDRELPHEQRLRDVIGLEIGDGTPEIMKGVIAREVFGKEFVSYR